MTLTITVEEEDEEQLRAMLDGTKWRGVVRSLDEWLRCKIKYGEETPSTMEDVRKYLHDTVTDEGLRIAD